MAIWLPLLIVGGVFVLGEAAVVVAGVGLLRNERERDRAWGRTFIGTAIVGFVIVAGSVVLGLTGGTA